MSIIRLIYTLLLLAFFIIISIPIQILLNIFAYKFKNIYAIYFYKIIKLITGLKITYDKKNHNRKKKGTLYVANHVSWFDIICLGTLLNARFIAKKEVSKMGIFGFLAKLSNTFFIDNSDKNKIIEYNHIINQKLSHGENFIIFPEGTTSDGNGIKQFKSSMLECAFDEKNLIHIQPISICYSRKNNLPMGLFLRRYISWVGDTSMVDAMINFLSSGPVTVELVFHNELNAGSFNNRKDLTYHCENQILQGINQTLKIS